MVVVVVEDAALLPLEERLPRAGCTAVASAPPRSIFATEGDISVPSSAGAVSRGVDVCDGARTDGRGDMIATGGTGGRRAAAAGGAGGGGIRANEAESTLQLRGSGAGEDRSRYFGNDLSGDVSPAVDPGGNMSATLCNNKR